MDRTTIAQNVLAYLASEGVTFTEDLGQVEQVLREQMLAIGAEALRLHVQERRAGYEGSTRGCSCGQRQRFEGYRLRVVATLLGAVPLRRAYYRCPSCGASCFPYDEQAGLGRSQVSVGLAKAATLLGVHEPFESAARMLYELTGQRLSERSIERLTQQVGQVACAEEEALAKRCAAWDPPAAAEAPSRLYVAVDGVMVHREDGWREAKTAVCYWDDSRGGRKARYVVRFEEAATFAAFVWSLACRCGLRRAKEVILLGDGARWIWDQVGPLLEGATCIVDWYHALQHVWACGMVLYGEGTEACEQWVKRIEAWLWEGDVRAILEWLERERGPARSGIQREALDALLTYLRNQDGRLAYDRFRARGLDIGSGRVEAACKSVVGVRMKRNGMRWSPVGAQTTLSLRARWMNGDWERFWATQPLAA